MGKKSPFLSIFFLSFVNHVESCHAMTRDARLWKKRIFQHVSAMGRKPGKPPPWFRLGTAERTMREIGEREGLRTHQARSCRLKFSLSHLAGLPPDKRQEGTGCTRYPFRQAHASSLPGPDPGGTWNRQVESPALCLESTKMRQNAYRD